MKFGQYLMERMEKQVYIVKANGQFTLWFAYAKNSGNTYILKPGSYASTYRKDDNYNGSLVNEFIENSDNMKKIKSVDNKTLYEIPVYLTSKIWDEEGVIIKPDTKWYFILTEERKSILSWFDRKNEAMSWLKN